MQKELIPINPAMLVWARETAGLSLRDAVMRAKITPSRSGKEVDYATPEHRLAEWEGGQETPTFSQLNALAKAYRRPLVTFFLAEPPTQFAPLTDYRNVPNHQDESPEFAALKRRIFQLERELHAIAKDEEAESLTFVGSCSIKDGLYAVVDAIRQTLGVEPVAEHSRSADDIFRILREKAEMAGVYVVLMGGLGSYHSKVDPDEFRGIAIADQFAPLIVINSNDTKVAMPFTLAHELAHIFLGSSNVSNQNAFELRYLHKSIEQFCNSVAAELLVPERLLRQAWDGQSSDLVGSVKRLARIFCVSNEDIASRLSDLGFISEDDYEQLFVLYRNEWKRCKKKNKESAVGPNPNTLPRYNLGMKTLGTLRRAVDDGLITLQDAAYAINMSVARFEKVVG